MNLLGGTLILTIFSVPIGAYDFIRDALQNIDQQADPCDDFYRHVCPLGHYGDLVTEKFKPVLAELYSKQTNYFFRNLEYQNALKRLHIAEIEAPLSQWFLHMFETNCQNGDDTTGLLKKIEHFIHGSQNGNCHYSDCLTPLAHDENCTRSAEILYERLEKWSFLHHITTEELNDLKKTTDIYFQNLNVANAVIDANLREGVEFLNDMVESMKNILLSVIGETPWVINNGAEEFIKQVVIDLNVPNDVALQLRNDLEGIFTIESNYLSCLADVISDYDELFCLLYANRFSPTSGSPDFDAQFGAFNQHPELAFGFPLYYIATHTEELAGKLGFIGIMAGHEISHSVIEDPQTRELLPVSSTEAIKCIQDLHNATCEEFKEEACYIGDHQIDENGSDILGLQLAYSLFAEAYEDMEDVQYISLPHRNITYNQLFFYAAALPHCVGKPNGGSPFNPHSVGNIRANVFAQHPAFNEAFQCSPDSRMMKNVKKVCAIYGDVAPEQKKIRRFSKKNHKV